MQPYAPSPKVVIIAGPRCSGKTYTGRKLAEEMMFSCISQDHVRLALQKEHGLSPDEMSHPRTMPLYKGEFMKRLREIRYSDIVVEGARLAFPFVHQALMDALHVEYGDYFIAGNFFLLPDVRTRYERYSERILKHIDELDALAKSPSPDPEVIKLVSGFITSPFDAFPHIPEGFHVVQHPDVILEWVSRFLSNVHPDYPMEHTAIIEEIAKSTNNFSPFYQSVDVFGKRIIKGQTSSYLTWENIQKLGIDFQGKHVCEIGCNNGYFLFKAEELGAVCKGFEINAGSVSAALSIKKYIKSEVEFEVRDISRGFDGEYDILMALNMLHYVENLDEVLCCMAKQSKQMILEVGKGQLEAIVSTLVRCGHKLNKVQESHRKQGVIGERVILHFVRKA